MLFVYKEISDKDAMPKMQAESIESPLVDIKNLVDKDRHIINELLAAPYFKIDTFLKLEPNIQEKIAINLAQKNPEKFFYSIGYLKEKPYIKSVLLIYVQKRPDLILEMASRFSDQPYGKEIIFSAAKKDPTMALIFSHQYKDQPYFDQIIKTILPNVDISYMTSFLEMAHASGHHEYSFDYHGASIQMIYNNADNYLIRAKIDQIYEKYYGKNPDYNFQFSNRFPKLNDPVNKNKTIHFDEELKGCSTPIKKRVRRKFLEKRINAPITNQYGLTYDQNGIPIGTFDYDLDTINHSVKNNVNKSIQAKLNRELLGIKMDENRQKNLVRDYTAMIELPMRANLEENFGIRLENFNLRIQIQFLNFLKTKTEAEVKQVQKFINKSENEIERHHRLKAFLALESEPNMEKVILKLGKHPQAEKIFARFAEIMEIFEKQEEILREHMEDYENKITNIDFNKLYLAITRKGNELLRQFANHANIPSNQAISLEDIKKYQTDIVTWGALFSSASKEKGNIRSPEEMNRLIKAIDIKIQPGGKLVKSMNRESMKDPENYTHPEIFNENDYEMIVRNLKQSYQKIDPGWLDHLIDNIPKDLNNPDVKFILVRNTKNNQLAGLIKSKKDTHEKGAYYFGTQYVEPEFQRAFGIGNYLQKLAESTIPEKAKIVATVATANTAIERHIDFAGGIGTAITFESDENHSSKELIKLQWRQQGYLETKDSKKYSREKIKEYARGHNTNEIPENINIYSVNTHPDNNDLFLNLCQKHFSEGKVITRIFYEKVGSRPSLAKTYVVFEKPKSKNNHQSTENYPFPKAA